MKTKSFSIPVKSSEQEEAVLVSYDKTNIAPNPFKQIDWERESIMRELDGAEQEG